MAIHQPPDQELLEFVSLCDVYKLCMLGRFWYDVSVRHVYRQALLADLMLLEVSKRICRAIPYRQLLP